MATIKKAAIPARKSPSDPRMLLAVAVASADTTRLLSTPKFAKAARTARKSKANPAVSATVRWEWTAVGRFVSVIDWLVILFPCWHSLLAQADATASSGDG
jgi:hypothetical protein